MAGRLAISLLVCSLVCGGPAIADPPGRVHNATIERICQLIQRHARRQDLPAAFLARLIWKESRFVASAVSPKGAEGIAQFMPATARLRGLRDPFDVEQAIPASARYLGELRSRLGNLGLAAAAYNAGEARVARWLASGGFLPLETERYVLDIMGRPADAFVGKTGLEEVPPLEPERPFAQACRALPLTSAGVAAMTGTHTKPWGVQVAGNFDRAAAIRQFERMRRQFPVLRTGPEPVVSRVRSPIGRRGIFAVRIGADSREEAEAICSRLRAAGGACAVMRNR